MPKTVPYEKKYQTVERLVVKSKNCYEKTAYKISLKKESDAFDERKSSKQCKIYSYYYSLLMLRRKTKEDLQKKA